MSLDKLIKDCAKRKADAQEQIYRLYAGKLFGLCLKYSRSKEEAEDNLQDAFITIFDKIHQYKHKGSFEGWMKRIVINTALQKYRDKKILHLVHEEIEDEAIAVDIDDSNISLDDLLKIIQSLPNQYRLVFNLYVMDGYSHREIADELGISEGTSKSNLSRARATLREKLIDKQKEQGFLNFFK